MLNFQNILPKYFRILNNETEANFLNCKMVKSAFKKNESNKTLFQKHKKIINDFKCIDLKPNQSLLDLKIQIAKNIFKKCSFCQRKCNTNRDEKAGLCNVKETKVSSEFLHIGEENILVPSHTIFFSGCSLNCIFCQNWDISQSNSGIIIDPKTMAKIIISRHKQGSKNVNWVGGDPTPNFLYILETLQYLEQNIAQIWNSNMYYSKKTMYLLECVIDLYLTDFKYGNDKCAKELSKVSDYTNTVKRNHKFAYKTAELIIRHLILPNHIECCSKPILNWIAKNLPESAVNIMAQYRPEYKSKNYPDINRAITASEYLEVKKYAQSLGLFLI